MGADSTVDDSREQAEFNRIKYHQVIEKTRLVIGQYEKGLALYRREIEKSWCELGKLDQRLGDK